MKSKPQKRRQDPELENSFTVLQEADYSNTDNEESSAEKTESTSQEESTHSYSSS